VTQKIDEQLSPPHHLLYEGRGRGSQLDSARGTAWGLLNSVTEFVDHERRARSNEYRMDSAWFG
jgi:hypothetical protein